MTRKTDTALNCKCGGQTYVTQTRSTTLPLPGVRRRRICNKCGARFSTLEIRNEHFRLKFLIEYILDRLQVVDD